MILNENQNASGRNDKSFNNINKPIMSTQNGGIQSNGSFNNMIKIMKDNGFNNEALDMSKRDFDDMNKLVTNMSDIDYKEMINIMQKNGYGYIANMIKSVSRENMTNTYQDIMGR